MTPRPTHALVLAGSRGPTDPVASASGLPHKALVPVLGVPMLLRVVRTLLASGEIRRIILSVDAGLRDHGLGPELEAFIDDGILEIAEPKSSPSASVASVVDQLDGVEEAWPLLVTTADHPLLTPPMVKHFLDAAPEDTDLCIGLAGATIILQHYPDAIRTFYRFAGEGFSGCNLFMLGTPKARAFVTFWQEMERYRKKPWRLVAAIGPLMLLRFLLGRLSIEQGFDHLSKKIGATARAVLLPFAEAAIDVDKPADLDLAETILKAREAAG